MAPTISELHYARVFIEGSALSSPASLHEELAFKLGLPAHYAKTWDALLECLSSTGTPQSNLCRHWEFRSGKRLLLQILNFNDKKSDPQVLASLATTIAEANRRLSHKEHEIRIWLEFVNDGSKSL